MSTLRILGAVFIVLFFPSFVHAETEKEGETFVRGKVISVTEETTVDQEGITQPFQRAELEIISGPEKGQTIIINHGLSFVLEPHELVEKGDTVVVNRSFYEDTGVRYYIIDSYRIPQLALLVAAFFALAIYFGRRKGLLSIIGLLFSIVVIFYGIIPLVVNGYPPFLVCSVAAFLILVVSLYLSHGFHRRTTIAVVSSAAILLMALGIDSLFTTFAHIFGFGSEEAVYLSFQSHAINPKGIFLGGVILGVLGILDDVTTAQTAAVEEIYRANPAVRMRDLYARGISVGKEHIASLINTLVLAYIGASFPLFVLIYIQKTADLWLILNGQFIAEEIVRTLVGSCALVLAVPLVTLLSAYWYTKKGIDPKDVLFETHGHHH